jgi:hypothetical protein
MFSHLSRSALGAALALALPLLAACGNEPAAVDAAAEVTVTDAWIRSTTGTTDTTMTAAFLNIDNEGDSDVTLVGASSSISPMVQIHEMAMVDGAMVMQELKGGLKITAGQGKSLAPGGNHIMLMGLAEEIAVGDEVALTLRFSDGSTLELTLPAKAFTEEEPHYHSSTSPMP